MPKSHKYPKPTVDEPEAIAEASLRSGISQRMLRYFETAGVIQPSRGPGGHRRYSKHDILLLRLIRELTEQGSVGAQELRILRETAMRDVEAALRDPLLTLRLLYLRQAAEGPLHAVLESRIGTATPPPTRLTPLQVYLPNTLAHGCHPGPAHYATAQVRPVY